MRARRTRTTSFSLDDATLKNLKAPLSLEAIERIEAEWRGATSPKKKRRRVA